MRRISVGVGFLVCALSLAAAPGTALAGFGALAYDESTKKYGLSSNEDTQAKAEDVARKECGGEKCKVIFRTKPRQCGAIAIAESGEEWGGGVQPQRAAAELDAIKNCQKRSKGQCKVRSVECNR